MGRDEPTTGAGRALRSAPWLLAGSSLAIFVTRLAIGGASFKLGPVLGFTALGVAFVALLIGWSVRLDNQAMAVGEGRKAVFSCSTTLQRQLLKDVPRFSTAMGRVRMSWLIGGWLMGKLFVDEDGFTFSPNFWTKRVFRAPDVGVRWDEVQSVAAIDQPGPRDPGIFEAQLADGSSIAFMVTRRKDLAVALEQVRPR